MATCLYGSRKKASAPTSFTIDTGAICFLLGLQSGLCPMLDRIPNIVGKPWKEIIESVVVGLFNYAWDAANNRINTVPFCAVARPAVPTEINYADVFQFLLSYVPPFSVFITAESLLGKITAYYLYEKWSEYCECKPANHFPDPNDPNNPPPTIPPFVPTCPASNFYSSLVKVWIDRANDHNSVLAGTTLYWAGEENGFDRNNPTVDSSEYQQRYVDAGTGSQYVIVNENPIFIDSEFVEIDRSEGCLTLFTGFFYPAFNGSIKQYYDIDFPDVTIYAYGVISSIGYSTVRYDERECCENPPPPPPDFPPPPSNCPPPPSVEYCRKFPDDPLCANCPECTDGCEPTIVTVKDYLCISGLEFKEVEWKL